MTVVLADTVHGDPIVQLVMKVSLDVKVALLVRRVPVGVARSVRTTSVYVAVVPAGTLTVPPGGPQVTVPLVPIAGVVHVAPAGGVNETKVVLAGSGSVMFMLIANTGWLLVIVMVYVIFAPATTGSGASDLAAVGF